jgi:hypothetical protein
MENIHDEIFLGIEKELLSQSEKIVVLKAVETLAAGKAKNIGSGLNSVTSLMQDKDHYIVFDKTIIKGRKQIFRGDIIMVNKGELLAFLANAFMGLAVRRYYIIPADLSLLLYISEEGGAYLFGK